MILSPRCQSPHSREHLNRTSQRIQNKERVVNQNCTHDVETVFIVYTLSFILVFLILISIFFSLFLLRTYKITSLYSCFCAWFVRCFEFIPNIKSLHSLFTCFQCFVSCSFWCCVGKTNDRVEKRQCVPNIWGTKKTKANSKTHSNE